MFPEFINILLCERLSFFNIIFLTDRHKLRVVFLNDIVFHSVLIHLAVQFFDVGKAGVAQRAFVQCFLHMVFADGTEAHFV